MSDYTKRNMNTLGIAVFLVHCIVLLKVCSGASQRHESAKPRTMVILFHTLEKTNTTGQQVDRRTNLCEKYDYVEDYEDYDLPVDYDSNQPRVAFSTKPKHPSAIPTTEKKKKGKGEGRMDNPCMEEHRGFCFNGVCHYSKDLNSPVCRCQVGYSGVRCESLVLDVSKKEQRYSRTTALAVIAVVLSFTCLTVIAILLALRYHKKDDADEESAEVIREERKMEPKRTDGTEEKQGHKC